MRKLEKEEEILGYDDPDKKVFHLCIVNLVIGTLYCSKANFQVWERACLCMYVLMYVCMYVCMYVHMYVYV